MITSSKINKLLQKNITKNLPQNEVRLVCTYRSLIDSEADYDVDTKIINETNPVSFNCEVIFLNFTFTINMKSVQGIDTSNIKEKDKKGLLFGFYCPDGFKPSVDDEITVIATNEKWIVKGFSFDPYKALHLLHLRPIVTP